MTIVLGVKKQINRSEWVSDERELIEFLMVVTHVDDEEDQRLDAGGSWFMMLKCWYSLMTVSFVWANNNFISLDFDSRNRDEFFQIFPASSQFLVDLDIPQSDWTASHRKPTIILTRL